MTPKTTPSSRREVLDRLKSAQKSNRGAAGYSRWINRPLGRQFAVVAFRAGLRPNQVSVASAVLTFSAILLVATVRPSWPVSVAIMIMLVLGYALDSADGQVARLRGGGTPAGEWLDHVFDAVKASTIHLAVAVMWFRFFALRHDALLLVPLAFAVASAVFFFTMILTDMLRRIERAESGLSSAAKASLDPSERAPVLRSLVVLPNDYGVLCLVFVLTPLHDVFVIVYAVLAAANIAFLLVGAARWFREVAGFGS